jgi:DNA-binding transcriptional ArsR family regulator
VPSRRPAHTHRRDITLDEHVGVMADLFDLLSDPTRLRLLLELRERDEVCVSELAGVTDTTESAVSHALRLLRTAGIVAPERRGRRVYYRLADEHARIVLDATLAHLHAAHLVSTRQPRARRRPSVA